MSSCPPTPYSTVPLRLCRLSSDTSPGASLPEKGSCCFSFPVHGQSASSQLSGAPRRPHLPSALKTRETCSTCSRRSAPCQQSLDAVCYPDSTPGATELPCSALQLCPQLLGWS